MSECAELERTHLLADGELSPDEAADARAHVATCAACQAELADIVQLALVADAAPRVAPGVVSLAWYRRRRVQVVAIAVAAAAAAVPVYLTTRGGGGGVIADERREQIALAPKRSLEARLAWGPAAAHREYDVPRAGDAAHEDVPLIALAGLEQRGDHHGVGALALLNGDGRQAASSLERARATPDVLADRAALALADRAPDRALALLDAALAGAPGHAAATWNRALALRDLGLTRAAAAAFRAVAARGEPGWAEEAAARAAALEADTDARRDRAHRVWGAMRELAAGGSGLSLEDIRAMPGMAQLVLYDALRAAPTAARIAALAPLFEPLGAGARATLARAVPRPVLAAGYAAIIAGAPPAGAARAGFRAAARAARADELLIGALIKLSPDGHTVEPARLPELARLAAASPDPWFQLLGLEQQAAALVDTDLVGAEALLLRARGRCAEPAAPGYRCLKIETLLAKVYRNWQRLPEERAVLAQALTRARRDNEWFIELELLGAYVDVAVLDDDVASSGLPMIAAYAEEVRLRSPEPALCRTVAWTRVMTAMALINKLRFREASAELAAAPVCDAQFSPNNRSQQLFVRAHLVRESGSPAELAALRAELAALRDDPATPPPVRIVADHSEGRAVIDRDPAAGEALLRRAIAGAKAAPAADAVAHKAGAWSYAVLAIAAARRGDGAAALATLAEEQGVEVPARCVLGLALDDQRRIAVGRDAAGAPLLHYDEDRRTPAIDPATLVPAALVAALAPCAAVAVIARSPIHGTPRLLPETIAWRYLASRAAELAPAGSRELVIANVEPPAALGLARLAPWSGRGDRITGAAATPERVLTAMADAGIVTLHAHGLVDLGRPGASFLALSPDRAGRYTLTAGEVHAARFRTSPLVILAACRASQAAPVLHEPWSLPVAFVHAGARAVIASASPIPDADAAPFFDDLRARIAANAPVAVALRDARAAWLAGHRDPWVRDVIVFE